MVDFYRDIDDGSATKFKRAYEFGSLGVSCPDARQCRIAAFYPRDFGQIR